MQPLIPGEYLYAIAGALAGVLLGLLFSWSRVMAFRDERTRLLAQVSDRENSLVGREQELRQAKEESAQARADLAVAGESLKQERERALEKISLLQQAQEQLKKEFENLANKIFDEKGKTFSAQNKESLEAYLKPFRE